MKMKMMNQMKKTLMKSDDKSDESVVFPGHNAPGKNAKKEIGPVSHCVDDETVKQSKTGSLPLRPNSDAVRPCGSLSSCVRRPLYTRLWPDASRRCRNASPLLHRHAPTPPTPLPQKRGMGGFRSSFFIIFIGIIFISGRSLGNVESI